MDLLVHGLSHHSTFKLHNLFKMIRDGELKESLLSQDHQNKCCRVLSAALFSGAENMWASVSTAALVRVQLELLPYLNPDLIVICNQLVHLLPDLKFSVFHEWHDSECSFCPPDSLDHRMCTQYRGCVREN